MALNALGKLEVVFTFKDQSKAGTETAKKNVKSLSQTVKSESKVMKDSLGGAFPAILTLGLLRQTTAALSAMSRPAIETGAALREMAAFSGQTTEQFKSFADAQLPVVKQLGLLATKETPDLVRGLTELEKKGLDAEAAMSALVPTTFLARIANQEVADTADSAAVIYKVWGEQGAKLSHRFDQMTLAANKSRIGYNELTEGLTGTSRAVGAVQPRFENLLFLLAKTRDESKSMANASTQVRISYERMLQKSDELSEVLGTDVIDQQTGQFRDLADMLFEVETSGGGLSSKMQGLLDVFGVKGFGTVSALVKNLRKARVEAGGDVDKMREIFFALREEIELADNTTADAFRTMVKENPQVILDRLVIAFQQLGEAGGGILVAPIVQFADALTSAVVGATKLADMVAAASQSVTSFVPGGEMVLDLMGRLTSALVVSVGAAIGARAAWVLLAQGFHFATRGLMSQAAAQAAVGASAAGAIPGVVGLATANGALASSTLFVARAANAVKVALGPVGLIVAGISLLIAAFGGFDDDVDKLTKELTSATDRSVITDIESAADSFSGSVSDTAKRFEDMFKETPAMLDAKNIADVQKQVATMMGSIDPESRRKLEPAVMAETERLQGLFDIVQTMALSGQEVDNATLMSLVDSLGKTAQFLQVGAMGTGSKDMAELSQHLKDAALTVQQFNKGTEERVQMFDEATLSSVGEKFFADPSIAVDRQTPAERADAAASKERENRVQANMATALLSRARNIAVQRESLAAARRGEQAPTDQAIIDSAKASLSPEQRQESAVALKKMGTTMDKVLQQLQRGINVNVNADTLNDAVTAGAAGADERSLSPSAGR